jgi:hypothetical protein
LTGARFPRRTLKAGVHLYRIHRLEASGWWFSCGGEGRFDPVGSGSGACYLALEPLAAWVEVFRKGMLIAEEELAARRLLSATLLEPLTLADLTSRRALSFGVTASIGADQHYEQSQLLAARLAQEGFDGILYLVRHDPAQRLHGVALFGPPGQASQPPAGMKSRSRALPVELVEQAQRTFGYRLLPAP